jgi:uncharacterized membrane protein YkoI
MGGRHGRRQARRGLAATLVLVCLLAAPALHAQNGGPWSQGFAPEPQRQDRGAPAVSLEQAVRRIEAETGGRVLSADSEYRDGRLVHRIKVLTADRRVRTYTVDAGGGRR